MTGNEINSRRLLLQIDYINILQQIVFASLYAHHQKSTHCHSIALDQFQHCVQVYADPWVTYQSQESKTGI